MAITRVQGNARGTATGGTSWNTTVTLDYTPTEGNVLVLTANLVNLSSNGDSYVPYVSGITQTNVTWTQQVYKSTAGATNHGNRAEIWFGVVGGSPGTQITVACAASAATTNTCIANCCEYSGIATSSFLDQTASDENISTTPNTGTTSTTTQASELWVGSLSIGGAASGSEAQSSPTNSFTLLDGADLTQSGWHLSGAYLEKIVSGTGTANTSTTATYSCDWAGCIATFKALVLYYPYIQQISNIDSVADVGTHSAFANQQTAADSTYDTLTEADTDAGTSQLGDTSGSGSSYRTTAISEMRLFSISATNTGEVASIVFYGRRNATSGTSYCKAIATDSSGNLLTNGVGDTVAVSTTAGNKTLTFTTKPLITAGTTYWFGLICDSAVRIYYDATTGGTMKRDTTNSYASPTSPTDAGDTTETWRVFYANITEINYELQLEEQFTSVPYDTASGFTLHVQTGAYSSPAETLNVEVWNAGGSAWVSLGALTASTDNSFDVSSYATSANLYIRFHDNTTTNDNVQSTWQIDSVWLAARYLKTFTFNTEPQAGGGTKTFTWNTEPHATGLTKTFTFNTQPQAVGLTKTFSWNTEPKAIGILKTFTFNTHPQAISLTKTFNWNTNPLAASLTKTWTWNTEPQVVTGQTATFTWNTQPQQLSITKTLTWNTEPQLHLTKTLTWDTEPQAGAATYTKTFSWNTDLQALGLTLPFTWDTNPCTGREPLQGGTSPPIFISHYRRTEQDLTPAERSVERVPPQPLLEGMTFEEMVRYVYTCLHPPAPNLDQQLKDLTVNLPVLSEEEAFVKFRQVITKWLPNVKVLDAEIRLFIEEIATHLKVTSTEDKLKETIRKNLEENKNE